jgi:hypothetical protein
MKNTRGSCALALLFLSDGKPSDHVADMTAGVTPRGASRLEYYADLAKTRDQMIIACIGEVASRFGRRLTVGTIGFAASSETFGVLQSLTERCKAYECQASFHQPALTAHSLQQVLSHLSSTLTSTKTELTSLDGSSQRTVRDLRREPKSGIVEDTVVNLDNWWSYEDGTPSFVMDHVIWNAGRWKKLPKYGHAQAVGVAMRNRVFGEGAERVVSKFREYDAEYNFVGPVMVAKESRFIEDVNAVDLKQFHEAFCKTQQKANRIADEFNKRLAMIPGVTSSTPRIRFLECSVYLAGPSTH